MTMSASPIFLFAMFAGVVALTSTVVAFRMRPAKQSRIGFALAVSPALFMLALFYSLAIHMHQRLGAWPGSLGVEGKFPAPLVAHGYIATNYFGVLLLLSIFVWPGIFLLCLLVRRWRVYLDYLGVYALAFLLCFGGMFLAPPQFLHWWWD
jgi:hypothetical protein